VHLSLVQFKGTDFQNNLINCISSEVSIDSSTFSDANNTRVKGLALYSEESDVVITNSTFANLSASLGSALYAIQFSNSQKDKHIMVRGSRFEDLLAFSGGAIYSEDTNLQVTSSNFSNSSANTTGGSLYLSCTLRKCKQNHDNFYSLCIHYYMEHL
jgi:hypothetical protein